MFALVAVSLPLAAMYLWLALASVSREVHGLWPTGGWQPENWRFLREAIGTRPSIWLVLGNTLLFAGGVAAVEVFVSAMAAYAISRLAFPGRGLYLRMVLVLHAFPAVSLLIAIFYVLRVLQLFDTLLGVVLVKVALDLPLGIWLLKGFFDDLPRDTEDAALVDGARRWTIFWRIALPLVRPGLLALGTLMLVSAWGEFILPFTLIVSGESWTLSLYLQSLIGDYRFTDFGLLAAVGLFYMAPVVVVFLVGQRYLLDIYGGGTRA
jgi:inositol-phosphate transport system permease protein